MRANSERRFVLASQPPQNENDIAAGSFVDFGGSELFMRTFEEGMAMVEETAAYLDGSGRQESRDLPRAVALAYAGESMRLTTRLMQVASWLLIQRSVFDGEMSRTDAASDKYRLGSKEICRGKPIDGADQLPAKLLDLLARSERLYDRVERLDDQLYARNAVAAPAGLANQMRVLETVFGPAGKTE
jgi:regulator of CtrA degradation